MKKAVFATLMALFCLNIQAQESQTAYNFLRIPVSAHAAALGGDNITINDDDESLIFSNPALLSNVEDKTILLNYMNYMQGAKSLSAAYDMDVMTRGKAAISAQMMDYGTMTEADAFGNQLGEFSAKDIAISGYFAYMLTDELSAGITAKFISSSIADYNSIGVGVDLGLNYYDVEREWSFSAVVKNLGGQLKAYDDEYEPMPLDLQAGVSKRLTGTPLRFNAALVDLTHWNYKLIDHVAFGADLILSKNIWVGGGYNFRRAKQMSIGTGDEESSHGAGFSLGAGLNLNKFKVNLAWGKYHVASSSVIINVAYSL